jgi:glycosyltransferase involved in cell wall biosynthesis
MVRILFLVNGFAIGGAEVKLLELVKEIKTRFPETYYPIVCAVGQGGPLQERFEKMNVETYVFPKKHKYDVSLIYKVYQLLQKKRIDILQTTLFYADIIGAYTAKLAGIKKVVSWDAMTAPYHYGMKNLLAYRLASKWLTVSVAVSHAIREKIVQERHVPVDKATTIHYGVDLRHFKETKNDPYRKKLGFHSKDIVLGTVARLSEQKGHRYLIDAVKKVVRKYPNIRVLFIGDGPLREKLEFQVHRLRLNATIQFLGFRSDIKELLGALDIFILPSLFEGLPNVILEAMACGKPVIATNVSGIPEVIVDHQTGILIPPKDSDAIAQAIFQMLRDTKKMRMMGKMSRKRVEEKFNLKQQVSAFAMLYEKMLS